MFSVKSHFRARLALLLGGLSLLAVAHAETPARSEEAGLCTPFPPLISLPSLRGDADAAPQEIQIQADSAVSSARQVTHFSGDVLIEQMEKRIASDQAEYDHNAGVLNASGNVRYDDGRLQFSGKSARVQFSTDQGQINDVHYRIPERHVSGQADNIYMDSAQQLRLQQATYTTCDLDSIDWRLTAGELKLDNESQQGTAKHVVVRFMNVPFLYLPYLRFPIGDQRMSGLLFPAFGNSDAHGVELSLPYYWNIAPHRDATITPTFLKKRGTKLDTEFRYLNAQNTGLLEIEYLANDQEDNGRNRQYYHWTHQATPLEGWNAAVDFQRVGDLQYFEDFGGGLDSASLTHLERHGTLTYNRPLWNLSLLAQDYQVLSGTTPHQRLPQLSVQTNLPEQDNRPHYALQAEWVRFAHQDANQLRGTRLDAMPSVRLPWQNEAMFFIPKLSLKATHYQLEQDYNGSDEHSLTQPVFSFDSGVFLERDTRIAGVNLLHTLEPRLFYLYSPYRDQSQLPLFDSGVTTASLSNLFSENRFTGLDRYGDANQVSASLTTRLLRTDSGVELFNASVGQIFYLDDRRVGLSGNVLETRQRSSLFAELHLQPTEHWRFDTEWQWDPEQQQTEVGTNQLQYRLDRDKIVRLAYRFRRNELETREAAFFWRLNPRWQFFANDKFDLKEEHDLERFTGVQYDSCCWAFRIMARKHFRGIKDGQNDYEDSIYFELVLKGLSSFGRRRDIDSFLSTAGLE
ncbi:MAG: LPS assembly protein LptD [Gammaproteobacteria bacterium]